MDGKPLLVGLVGNQQHGLLAERERRGAAEEMHGHHRRARRDDAGSLDDGRCVGSGVSHGCSADYAMVVSKPLRIFSSGNWRPMKTSLLSRCSPSFQGRWWSPSRIICTPWNTNRSGSSLKLRMPLQRRMAGPSSATTFWIQGKNLSALSALSVLIENDCMSSSW